MRFVHSPHGVAVIEVNTTVVALIGVAWDRRIINRIIARNRRDCQVISCNAAFGDEERSLPVLLDCAYRIVK